MVKNKFILAASAVMFSLFSCVDNDYDLSDIDTTVGVNANLTVPMNMDKITLKSILDIEEGSQIKEIDGGYAVVEDGTFESERINIPSFRIAKPDIASVNNTVPVSIHADIPDVGSITLPDDLLVFSFDMGGDGTEESTLNLDAKNVDKSIVDVSDVMVKSGGDNCVTLNISITFPELKNIVRSLDLAEIKLQLPKGLIFADDYNIKYNKNTGVLTYSYADNYDAATGTISISLKITGIDFKAAGIELVKNNANGQQELHYSCQCKIISGGVKIYGRNLKSNISVADIKNIRELGYKGDFAFKSDIEADRFSGKVQYDIEDINVNPISMKDIPDLLNQTGTNIELSNPQIYLQLNNPLYDYGLYASTSLELVANREGEDSKHFASSELRIDAADNKFCLSPTDPGKYYNGTEAGGDSEPVDFTGSKWVSFSSLGGLLSGNKLPESINVNVVDPRIPVQTVTDFKLGQDISQVMGTYVVYAPLALTDKSQIAYRDTIDGWNDDDVDAIIIKSVTVDALIDTDIPLGIDIEVYPIDKNGKKIEGVKGTASVKANAKEEPLNVKLEGEVRHLDGIVIYARASVADGNKESLKPSQTITIKNIRARVSGNYIKEL